MMGQNGKNDLPVVSAGLDWLTITAVSGEFAATLYLWYVTVSRRLRKEGHETKEWSAMGYEGVSTGPMKYGARETNEAIVILSGGLAERFGYDPGLKADRVTRLDLQVSLRWDKPDRGVASGMHKRLEALRAEGKKRPFLNLVQSSTGETLYIGKRDSDLSLRFYDRSSMMGEKELGSVWRYEVQYRRKAAKEAYRRLSKQTEPILWVIGMVAAEFEKRGVQARFGSSTTVTAIEVERIVTTAEGQLTWLEKCVAPVVSRLCLMGNEEAVINALSMRGIINNMKELE